MLRDRVSAVKVAESWSGSATGTDGTESADGIVVYPFAGALLEPQVAKLLKSDEDLIQRLVVRSPLKLDVDEAVAVARPSSFTLPVVDG
jgi:hypothetical protein